MGGILSRKGDGPLGAVGAIFVLAVWWLHDLPHGIRQSESTGMLVGALVIILVAAWSGKVLWVGVLLAMIAATRTAAVHRDGSDAIVLPDDEEYVG